MKTTRLALLVGSLLGGALVSPTLAQVTIDTFTTSQSTLTAPPDQSSAVTGGADIIGTTRGIVQHELAGAGPSTDAVAAGLLTLTVPNTTPDSRAEARLSWDGDLLPNVLDPVGLGGVSLTTGNATGLRIRVASAGANAELEFTVYSSAANFSRAARLLPVIASSTDIFVPFTEFRVAGGTGANFASVGAIELTVRGKEITVVLDEITTSLPILAATKTATQVPVDVDGDGRVDPGDRVRYTVTFTNTGNNAVGVDLTDTVDANTTLDAATVSATPVARNDQYGWFGNVTLSADGSPFPTLLANDSDPDGDTVTVQSVTAVSAQGGTVTLVSAATGEFSYVPPVGFKGVDSFSYTIVDNDAHTSTATAYVDLEGIVWFVDNGCTVGCGAGTQASPFLTLPAAETPSGANDIIYVRTGIAAYDTGPANGFTLDVDEQLLGEGVALVLGGTTIIPIGTPPTLTNNDGTPGRGLTLAGTGAGTDTVRGLTLGVTTAAKIFGSAFGTLATDTITLNGNGQALDLTNGVLATTFASITSGSSAATGITLNQVSGGFAASGGTTITASTGQGIFVTQSSASANFGNTSVTGGTDGVSLQNSASGSHTFGTLAIATGSGIGFLHALNGGTVSVTGATTITNPTGTGISISLSTSPVTFASTTINKGASSGIGLSLSGNTNTTTFSNLAVTTNAGPGIVASSGGTLTIAGTASTVAATGGPALDVTSTTFGGGSGATFATASSTGSTGKGMNLDTVTGALTMNGGSISTPAGIAFDLNAGSANVTYAGSISNVANAFLVEITGRTGGTVNLSGNLSSITLGNGINVASNTGGTINFSGATKTLTTGADPAVTLATNTGATINFTNGGLEITTTSGTGFTATAGATAITVQGTVNTINSTSGTALNVNATPIGASDLTFQSISSGNNTVAADPVNGIVLNGTGASGNLIVTGTGSASSGGIIQFTTGPAISLTSTTAPQFSWMNIHDIGRSGIDGQQVTDFTLSNSVIDNVGTGAAGQYEESNIAFNDNGAFTTTSLSGAVSITNNTLNNARRHGIQIENGNGTISNLTISNNILTSSTSAAVSLGTAILVLQQGSATLTSHLTTGTINGNTITNFPSAEGIAILGGSGNATNNASATLGANGSPIAITNNSISGQAAAASHMGSNAIRASMNSQFGVMNLNISNNGTVGSPITNIQGQGVSVFAGGSITGSTTIANNVIVANQTLAAGTQGMAVQVDDGPAGLGTSAADYNFIITSNNVSNYEGSGIRAIARASLGKMDVTIQNNTVGTPILANRNGIRIDSGSAAGDVTLCLLMTGNTSDGSGVNAGMGIRKQGTVATVNDFGIVGLSPSPTTGANAAAKVTADNPAGGGTDAISGDNFVSCTITP